MNFRSRSRIVASTKNDCYYTSFATRLGWMAIIARENSVKQLVFGYPSKKAVLAALDRRLLASARLEKDDSPLANRLRAYAEGQKDDFRDVAVDLDEKTAFHRSVLKLCRRIPFGKTVTYGELASRAGVPLAARAVGSCMARNRVPLIIPCHRVVPSSGRFGNFSAPGGTEMKARLLEMERQAGL
jgi:methylated-DNA-[protein]-cysteine S-methyltransferase